VITIDTERCTGCGACVEICPTGAIYLVDAQAMVDRSLCHECDACVSVCPTGAITLVVQEGPGAEAERMPALRPEPTVIQIKTRPALVPWRARVLPAVGAALVWAGREILPWMADLLLDTMDRRTTAPRPTDATRGRETVAPGAKGGGRQHRHRRRGSR
jgi:ferredoxin